MFAMKCQLSLMFSTYYVLKLTYISVKNVFYGINEAGIEGFCQMNCLRISAMLQKKKKLMYPTEIYLVFLRIYYAGRNIVQYVLHFTTPL